MQCDMQHDHLHTNPVALCKRSDVCVPAVLQPGKSSLLKWGQNKQKQQQSSCFRRGLFNHTDNHLMGCEWHKPPHQS